MALKNLVSFRFLILRFILMHFIHKLELSNKLNSETFRFQSDYLLCVYTYLLKGNLVEESLEP